MLPSHPHLSRYARERETTALAEIARERRTALATAPPHAPAAPDPTDAPPAPSVARRLWLGPRLRLRRDAPPPT